MSKSVIALAFSKDKDAFLPMLRQEQESVYNILQTSNHQGFIRVRKIEYTAIVDFFNLLIRYPNQVAIFHYGGHANGSPLDLEGTPKQAHTKGLAHLLGQQKNLKLVFLNGSATEGQIDALMKVGVKAVLATSVAIGDTMAKEFAEQFYFGLANGLSTKKAFGTAKTFVMTKYQLADVRLYSGFVKRGTNDGKPCPWGLYVQKGHEAILDWTLPRKSQHTSIIRNIPHQKTFPINDKLLEVLFHGIAPYKQEVDRQLKKAKRGQRVDMRKIKRTIIDSFPTPIGEQLRKLFANHEIGLERLEQLVSTYQIAMELLCYAMLSQFWNVKSSNQKLQISTNHLVDFHSFFALNAAAYPSYNHVKLIRMIIAVFRENQVPHFIQEIAALETSFRDKDAFYDAHCFMEEMKRALFEKAVRANEIEKFCLKAEMQLSVIFKKLIFLIKYKLTTIKSINIIKKRNKTPRYIHRKVILDQVTAGTEDIEVTYDTFTDSKAVVLLKTQADDIQYIEHVREYLTLSPFVIDENALTGVDNSKIFFFNHYQNRDYLFRFVDNRKDTLTISDKVYPQIKEQFEEFEQLMLK